jgi:prolyl oligopeptidase
VGVWSSVTHTPERQYAFIAHAIEFYKVEMFAIEEGRTVRLEIPLDAEFSGVFKNQMLIQLKSTWEVGDVLYPQGALISTDYDRFLDGDRAFTVVVAPDDRNSISQTGTTRDLLVVNMLSNIRGELFEYSFQDGAWSHRRVDAPINGTIHLSSLDSDSNRYLFYFESFIQPRSLFYVEDGGEAPRVLKRLPDFFDTSGLIVDQFETASKDGVKIPYFVVRKEGAASPAPTLLYGYGGFEISMQPGYSPTVGSAWLEQGGVYAVANIRGGGEFGPAWHQAGLKENRQRCFDDFAAVAEDLAARGITTAKQLGIRGGSNGGLLVGLTFTQRPDLYNAVVCGRTASGYEAL